MKRLRPFLVACSLALAGCGGALDPPPQSGAIVDDAATAQSRTRLALERIEELNPLINAVIAVDPTALDQARSLDREAERRGPLHGMPILIKDNIAFNEAHADVEMPFFGQNFFEQAEATTGIDSDAYRRAREISLRMAGVEGIDRLLSEYDVVALVGPTMSAAWIIDPVHGDRSSGGGAGGLPAVAGYPHLTVPMGQVRGLPMGLSFIGPQWSDGLVLSLGYAYEQASQKLIEPRFPEAID